MLYLIWAIINIAAYIYFFKVLIISGKLVRQKLGVLAACIFVLGLFSFIGVSHDKEDSLKPGTNDYKMWKLYTDDDRDKNMDMSNWIDLDSNWISHYTLFYKHGLDKGTHQRIPLEANSIMSGMAIGTRWKPYAVNMDPTPDGWHFTYSVRGTVQWYLMGINIYSQDKVYTGVAPAINHF